MIGPMKVTKKAPKKSEETSLMDYAPTDTGTEANISSVFYRPRDSRGVSTKSSLAAKKQGKRKLS